jgi:hypothetical protein
VRTDDKVYDATPRDPVTIVEEVTRYLPGLYLLFAAERVLHSKSDQNIQRGV